MMGENEIILRYKNFEFRFGITDEYEIVEEDDDISEFILMEPLHQRFYNFLKTNQLIKTDISDCSFDITLYHAIQSAVVTICGFQSSEEQDIILPVFFFTIE